MPFKQFGVPPLQTLPGIPQLSGSVFVSTHVLPDGVRPGLHVHVPWLQYFSAKQLKLHVLQWSGSESTFVSQPACPAVQSAKPLAHVASVQVVPAQVYVATFGSEHAAQPIAVQPKLGSLVATQLPPQSFVAPMHPLELALLALLALDAEDAVDEVDVLELALCPP
jgi:hypothetical protein